MSGASGASDNSRGCPMMFAAPSTAHGRGTLPSPASAAATKLMLRAARVPPRGAAASLLKVLLAAPQGGTRRRRLVEC